MYYMSEDESNLIARQFSVQISFYLALFFSSIHRSKHSAANRLAIRPVSNIYKNNIHSSSVSKL